MIRTWLAGALGSIFLAGSAASAGLPNNDRLPERQRPASSTQQTNGTSTRPSITVDVQCIAAAVKARELTLSTSATAFGQTVAGAYATRATALESAYTGTDAKAVRTASKSAWDAFSSTVKTAKKSWQTGRENAWKTFRTAVKSCKGAESVSDASNASLEQQGN